MAVASAVHPDRAAATLIAANQLMILEQQHLDGLADDASYLDAGKHSEAAAVLDPRRGANRLWRSVLLAATVLAVAAASAAAAGRALAGASGRPPAGSTGRPPGGAPGRPPGGTPGRPPVRSAHHLWYRLELVVSGQYWHDADWQDSSPSASTVSYSDHQMRSSKWTATTADAFILNRQGRHVTFSANLIGKVDSATRAETVTTTTGDNETCTTTVTGQETTPVGLTGFIRQSGHPDELGFSMSAFPRTGNYTETTDLCDGRALTDSCPADSAICEYIYLGGGQPLDLSLNRKDRPRQLAFKLPSLAHFGHSFSIRRTLTGNLPLAVGPTEQGTDVYRSRVDYGFNFTVCPRHGRDVHHC